MALASAQIEGAAAFLLHLRTQRQTATQLPAEIRPQTVDDAYDIADTIQRTAGWLIGVLKVGCTSALAQEKVGLDHPMGGRIPLEGVFQSGATIASELFGKPPVIECEFALQINATGEIVAVAPAVELPDARIQTEHGFAGLTTIADNAAGCAVVIGEPTPWAECEDLNEIQVELSSATSGVIARGSATEIAGGPKESVRWTLAHEAERKRPVPAGTWIITGTCTGITRCEPATTYAASFDSLGTVSFTVG